MPRAFDNLESNTLPPSLNNPRAQQSALSELTGGRPIGQVDIFGEHTRTRRPGALARALERDYAPMLDPYGRDQIMFENQRGAAFGVPGRGMGRRAQAFQGPEFSPGELGVPGGVSDAGSGQPVLRPAPEPQRPDYDHLGPFIEQQLRNRTRAETKARPELPKGWSYEDEPSAKSRRPELPKGWTYEDEPPVAPVEPGRHPMLPPEFVPPPARPMATPLEMGTARSQMAPPSGFMPPPARPPTPEAGMVAPAPIGFGSRTAEDYRQRREQATPLPPEPILPGGHRAPVGAPAGFQGQPPVVRDRSGRLWTVDSQGNLIPLQTGDGYGNSVE